MRFANVDDALLQINEPYDPNTGFADSTMRSWIRTTEPASRTSSRTRRWCSTIPSSAMWGRSTASATGSSSPRPSAAGTSPRSPPTTGGTTGMIGPVVLAQSPALLRSDRAGRGAVPDLRRQHRHDPRQHLGLIPRQRVPPGRTRDGDGLRRARSAGRHPDRRGDRGAPVPATESVVRAPAIPAARRARSSTTSGMVWDGQQHHPLERRGRGRARSTSARRSRPSASHFARTCSDSRSCDWIARSRRTGRRLVAIWTFSLGPTF